VGEKGKVGEIGKAGEIWKVWGNREDMGKKGR